jgi:hypothetical protein
MEKIYENSRNPARAPRALCIAFVSAKYTVRYRYWLENPVRILEIRNFLAHRRMPRVPLILLGDHPPGKNAIPDKRNLRKVRKIG